MNSNAEIAMSLIIINDRVLSYHQVIAQLELTLSTWTKKSAGGKVEKEYNQDVITLTKKELECSRIILEMYKNITTKYNPYILPNKTINNKEGNNDIS